MAGHSKWANIKHRKGANDAKRGKIFTKLIKEITVAARSSGPDPSSNPRLRLAIQNAKGSNMPKDTIERAIKKASGDNSADYITTTYEGYGPNGFALFVECMTDNINRTVSNVRATFNKYGGSLGKNGSIAFLFEKKGNFSIPLDQIEDEESLILELIEAGADDTEKDEDNFYISCPVDDFGNVQKKLESLGLEPSSAEVLLIPNTTIDLSDDDLKKASKLINAMEDDDDVQKVFHNINIKDTQTDII